MGSGRTERSSSRRRPLITKRACVRLTLLLALLLGGAIVNVAVAMRFVDTPSKMLYDAVWEVESFPMYEEDVDYHVPPGGGYGGGPPMRVRRGGHRECRYWGKGLCLVLVLPPESPELLKKSEDDRVLGRFEAGWPMPALATPWVPRYSVLDEVVDDRGIQWRLVKRLRVPAWPGFAVNTLLYAAILSPFLVVPLVWRWRRRIKRGFCVKCAYDLRGHPAAGDVCPECGWGAAAGTGGTPTP